MANLQTLPSLAGPPEHDRGLSGDVAAGKLA